MLSLAGELADLRDKNAAIELVNSGGEWAAKIVEPNARRTALVAFADRLLAAGASVNYADNYVQTALFLAAENGHDAVADRLLAVGASVLTQIVIDRRPFWRLLCFKAVSRN